MSENIHVQKPEITAKELAQKIYEIAKNPLSNSYFKLSEINKILIKHDLLPKEYTTPKSTCFDE